MEANIRASLIDLIAHGLLRTNVKLHGEIDGHPIEASLNSDGSINADGRIYSSLSVAAGSMITARTGRRSSKRSYYACNGWLFWHVYDANGDLKTLYQLRDKLRSV